MFQVEDGTAKVGKDFTHSSASLIQFDPGVMDLILHIVHYYDSVIAPDHI